MFLFVLCLFITIKQVISTHIIGEPIDPSIPRECLTIDNIRLSRCCLTKPMFPVSSFRECGILKSSGISVVDMWYNCESTNCLFRKNDLLLENGTIDYSKVKKMLDTWSAGQTNIEDGVKEAELKCLRKIQGPPIAQKPFVPEPAVFNHCDTSRLHACVWLVTLWNCKFHKNKICNEVSQKVRTCRPYLFQTEE